MKSAVERTFRSLAIVGQTLESTRRRSFRIERSEPDQFEEQTASVTV